MKPLAIMLLTGALMPVGALAQNVETQADFIDVEGNEVGTAHLIGTPQGVLFSLDLSGLPASQWVAFHVHDNGECNPEDSFESAGDHFNPADVEHGYLTETGPHAGDMPNQYVGADGVLKAEVFNPLVLLEGDDSIVGLALMLHTGADDYQSQPSGDAGDRLACAVIE